jgi:hypothetical protein
MLMLRFAYLHRIAQLHCLPASSTGIARWGEWNDFLSSSTPYMHSYSAPSMCRDDAHALAYHEWK